MEEDVEIELLLKSNEEILTWEASRLSGSEISLDFENEQTIKEQFDAKSFEDSMKSTDQTKSFENKVNQEENNFDTPITQEPTTVAVDNSEGVNYTDEVQELLDDHIVSFMGKEQITPLLPDGEGEVYNTNQGDQFINEFLSPREQHGEQLTESLNQLIGIEISPTKYSALSELISAQKLIAEREDLLKNLERTFQEKLYLVEESIEEIRETITSLSVKTGGIQTKNPSFTKTFFKTFGTPYFKDIYGFSPSQNADHAEKIKTDQTSVVLVQRPSYWNEYQQKQLLGAIKETLINEQSDKLINQVKKLKAMLNNCPEKKDHEQLKANLDKSQKELDKMKNKSFEVLISGENENRDYDWLKYSASIFDGEHSADECKRFWEVYLKPSINKSSWEDDEDLKLLDVAEQKEFQDWDFIAKSLGTNRSAYQCFVHFQTRLNALSDFTKGKWTEQEDERLINVINATRIGNFIPWTKVSSHMGSRTHIQIYNRFKNCLDPKLVKGRFTKGEDLLLAAGIEVFKCNYKELSSLLTNRSSSQIRERYERYIRPKSVNIGTWTLNEDQELLKLVAKYGERNWSTISKEMKTRSRTQARQRYRCIQKKMKTKVGWSIADSKRKNVFIRDKSLERTKKHVERIKKEIDDIEQSFNLTKTEKDTFRMEKLKELKDNIMMQTYKSNRKKRISTQNAKVINELTELFKYDQIKPPEFTKIYNPTECKNYFNELCFMAKHFGHELQIPDNKDEITGNPQLGNSLKYILLKSKNVEDTGPSIQTTENHISPSSCTNIDYIPPDSDTSIIMNKQWFNPPMDVSKLNFSEMFKPTVFDYSFGMHQDIWKSKIKRCAQVYQRYFEDDVYEPQAVYEEVFNMPPNHLTTFGFKSVLLSRARLKQDADAGRGCFSEESTCGFSVTREDDINNYLEEFQEILLTLFTWPRALSLSNISSGFKFGTKAKKVSVKWNNRNNNILTSKESLSKPGLMAVKKGTNKSDAQYNPKWRGRNQYTNKRKMKIEHLLIDKIEENDNCQVLSNEVNVQSHSKNSRAKKLKTNDENKSPVTNIEPNKTKQIKTTNNVCSNTIGVTSRKSTRLKSLRSSSSTDLIQSEEPSNSIPKIHYKSVQSINKKQSISYTETKKNKQLQTNVKVYSLKTEALRDICLLKKNYFVNENKTKKNKQLQTNTKLYLNKLKERLNSTEIKSNENVCKPEESVKCVLKTYSRQKKQKLEAGSVSLSNVDKNNAVSRASHEVKE